MLSNLRLNDPYLVKNSDEVVKFLSDNNPRNSTAISIDVEDLFHSLEQGELMCSVKEAVTEHNDELEFTQRCGMSLEAFLELLLFYLNNTFVEWNDQLFVQKTGICIGSRVAPMLSEMHLSRVNRRFQDNLKDVAGSVFRYVDDYLVFFSCINYSRRAADILKVFRECGYGLRFTVELVKDIKGQLR